MSPLPRHPELDRRLAEEGATPEVLQVYGDWLTEREHPFGVAIRDAVLAEHGDEAARRRTLVRRFEATNPNNYGMISFVWCTGAVVAVDFTARDPSRRTWLPALFDEPWASLTAHLRIEAEAWQSDPEILDTLPLLPPSVGRIEMIDARMPSKDVQDSIDLSAVDLPYLRDLRLRGGPLLGLPKRIDGLVRFELCVPQAPALLHPVQTLQTLHLFSDVGEKTVRMLVEGAPALREFGLHHPGTLREAIALLSTMALPKTLAALTLAVPQQQSDLTEVISDLSRIVPHVQRIYLPFVTPEATRPLPGHISTEPSPDQPFYVL